MDGPKTDQFDKRLADRNPPMTDDKLYTSLSANTIMAKLTNHVQRTRLITSSTDKHYSLDSEDDFRSGCRNVSHHNSSFQNCPHPDDHTILSHYTAYALFQNTNIIYNMVCLSSTHTNYLQNQKTLQLVLFKSSNIIMYTTYAREKRYLPLKH